MARSTPGVILQEPFHNIDRAEFHHPFDAGAIVPAAVENHDFSRRRKLFMYAGHTFGDFSRSVGAGMRHDAEKCAG